MNTLVQALDVDEVSVFVPKVWGVDVCCEGVVGRARPS